jgi:purine nucleosidase
MLYRSLSVALLGFVALLYSPSAIAADTDSKEKIILDQDALGPATSNLESLLMIIQSPRADVLGITVISGDGWRDENVAHTLRTR